MNCERLREFSVYLDQRPGELAGLLDHCAVAGVDVSSLVTAEHNDRGVVRVIGTPVEKLRAVCEGLVEAGVGPVVETEVVAVPTQHKPGALREIAVLMADNRINVRYCYLAPSAGECPARCVFRFDDIDAAWRVLGEADWPTTVAPDA